MTQSILLTELTPNRYYTIKARHLDIRGNYSDWTILDPFLTAQEYGPKAPTGVELSYDPSHYAGQGNKITLTLVWVAPTKKTDESDCVLSKFDVQIDAYIGGVWVEVNKGTPGKSETRYDWDGAAPNTLHRGRVRAVSRGNTNGEWSGYQEVTTTIPDTVLVPTPTGLAVHEHGVKIHAVVDKVSKKTYPTFDGFKFYAKKSTITDGDLVDETYLVQDKASNRCNFQKLKDGTAIEIGETVHVRVKTADINEKDSPACADVSVVAGGAALSAPASLTAVSIEDESTPNKIDALIDFTFPRVSGAERYCLEYWYIKGGNTKKKRVTIEDPGLGDVVETVHKLECGINVYARVCTVKTWAIKSGWTNLNTTYITTWKPAGTPDMNGVSLTAVAKAGKVSLVVTKPSTGFNYIDKWQFWKSTSPSFPGGEPFLETPRNQRKPTDHAPLSFGTYNYYWVGIFNIFETPSATQASTSCIPVSAVRKSAGKIIDEADGSYVTADHINDGSTNRLLSTTEKTGAGRAANALDSSNRLITQVHANARVGDTYAQKTVPSAYFLDLRLHNESSTVRHITADWVTLHDNANSIAYGVGSVDVTNNIGVQGAGGRGMQDAAFTSVWVSWFIIANSTSGAVSSLSSRSATLATADLPAGYDRWARVGSSYIDAGGLISSGIQIGNKCWQGATVLTNGNPSLANAWQTLSISASVPDTAKAVFGYFGLDANPSSGVMMDCGTGTSYADHYQRAFFPDPGAITGGIANPVYFEFPIVTAQTLYWRTDVDESVHGIQIKGWIDDI